MAQKNKRILISLTYYYPYSSGLTIYAKRLAEDLVKKNYKVNILCMQDKVALARREIVHGVGVNRAAVIAKISKGFLSLDFLVKSFTLVQQADTVIVNLPQVEGFIPALFAKIFRKKLISIYHCEVVLPAGLVNRIVEKVLTGANSITLWLSNTIVTYTEDFANSSHVLPRFRSKLNYVYPPIPVPKVNDRVKLMIKNKIGENTDYVIGVAARLAAEKGMEYLLEAVPLLKDKLKMQNAKCKIVVAGPMDPVGEERYKKKILTLVEKYRDDVIFLGELQEEDMGSFYSLLDVLVLPSVNSTEAFGMVQVEAMMVGIPVVASGLPGVRVPIIISGMGKVVPPKDSEKLSLAIADILLHKKSYLREKQEVIEEFSSSKTVAFWEELLSWS